MRATNALPTEERVQRMNDVQWLWYYINLQKDLKEEEDTWKYRLLYIAQFINSEQVKNILAGIHHIAVYQVG
jgi:hypothetical protein